MENVKSLSNLKARCFASEVGVTRHPEWELHGDLKLHRPLSFRQGVFEFSKHLEKFNCLRSHTRIEQLLLRQTTPQQPSHHLTADMIPGLKLVSRLSQLPGVEVLQ